MRVGCSRSAVRPRNARADPVYRRDVLTQVYTFPFQAVCSTGCAASKLQVGVSGSQRQRVYLPPGQVAAALGDVAAELPPQSCSGRHRRSCSGEGCGAGPPARRAHAQVVCRSAARAVHSREESPDGLLRWGRMARPWPGIKAGRGETYPSDAGLNINSGASALYPLTAALQVSRCRCPHRIPSLPSLPPSLPRSDLTPLPPSQAGRRCRHCRCRRRRRRRRHRCRHR